MTTRVKSVALNAMYLSPGDSGGPETYLRELVGALAGEYPVLRIVVLTTRAGESALRTDGFAELAELRALPADEYQRLRRQFSMPGESGSTCCTALEARVRPGRRVSGPWSRCTT